MPLGSAFTSDWESVTEMTIPWAEVAGYAGAALGTLANRVLILAIGLYLTASPLPTRG